MFNANILLHGTCFDLKSSPKGNMALSVGIPSIIKKQRLVFRFITHIKSKSGFKKKPYDRTTQFFTRLHYQTHKRCQIYLVRGCLTIKEITFK
jgi:hypothetical protein